VEIYDIEKMDTKDLSNSNPLNHFINRQSGNSVLNFRQKLFKERLSVAKNLYKKDLVSHFGCVNAIEFSNTGSHLISGKFNFHCLFLFLNYISISWRPLQLIPGSNLIKRIFKVKLEAPNRTLLFFKLIINSQKCKIPSIVHKFYQIHHFKKKIINSHTLEKKNLKNLDKMAHRVKKQERKNYKMEIFTFPFSFY
jgi:hypothetical protein